MFLCGGIIELNRLAFHQVVQYRKSHIRVDGTRTVAHQQRHVHDLAHFRRLHDNRSLRTLHAVDEMVVHRRRCKQRRYRGVGAVHVAVADYDVVVAVIHSLDGILAQGGQGSFQRLLPSFSLEEHRQGDGTETLVSEVAQGLQFRIGEYGRAEFHHFAQIRRRGEYVAFHGTDVAGQRHHRALAYGVDRRVGDLRELLLEVVEETLRLLGQHGERSVVSHSVERLGALCCHRHYNAVHILLAVVECAQKSVIIRE